MGQKLESEVKVVLRFDILEILRLIDFTPNAINVCLQDRTDCNLVIRSIIEISQNK